MFTPTCEEMIQFDEHIFQMGWFNHQPVMYILGNHYRCHIWDLLPTQDSSHHQDEWMFSGEFCHCYLVGVFIHIFEDQARFW